MKKLPSYQLAAVATDRLVPAERGESCGGGYRFHVGIVRCLGGKTHHLLCRERKSLGCLKGNLLVIFGARKI